MMDKISAIVAESFVVGSIAVYLYPSHGPINHLPVSVQGDGNCQFRAASLLLTGCLSVCVSVNTYISITMKFPSNSKSKPKVHYIIITT